MSVNRHLVDWRAASPRGSDKTEYVILDTGEKMTSVASIEDNKTKTIDVSTYSEPVEVSPSDGYDSMAKSTIALSNIPSIEANKTDTISANGTVTVDPSSGYDSMAKATLTVNVNSKLFAWSRTGDEDVVYYVYTLTETPTTTSKAYYANPDSGTDKIFQILNHTVDAVVSDSVITVDSENYTRAIAADITL